VPCFPLWGVPQISLPKGNKVAEFQEFTCLRQKREKPSRLVTNFISALYHLLFTNLITAPGDVVMDSQHSEARNQPWNHAYNNQMLEIEVHSNPKHPFKMRKTTEMMGSLQLI